MSYFSNPYIDDIYTMYQPDSYHISSNKCEMDILRKVIPHPAYSCKNYCNVYFLLHQEKTFNTAQEKE